jgi:hypothetical protein
VTHEKPLALCDDWQHTSPVVQSSALLHESVAPWQCPAAVHVYVYGPSPVMQHTSPAETSHVISAAASPVELGAPHGTRMWPPPSPPSPPSGGGRAESSADESLVPESLVAESALEESLAPESAADASLAEESWSAASFDALTSAPVDESCDPPSSFEPVTTASSPPHAISATTASAMDVRTQRAVMSTSPV